MITIALIIIIGLISYSAFNKPELMSKLIFNPYIVNQRKEYYRFLSSGFVHGSWGHLAFNLFTFYFFGNNVEQIYAYKYGTVMGGVVFVLIFFLGIVVSEIPTYKKYINFAGYNSLGASGGVSTILFISILYFPLEEICLYGILCLPGFILGILYLIYSAYSGKANKDNINHSAHFTGAAFGLLIAIIIEPRVILGFFQKILEYRIF